MKRKIRAALLALALFLWALVELTYLKEIESSGFIKNLYER